MRHCHHSTSVVLVAPAALILFVVALLAMMFVGAPPQTQKLAAFIADERTDNASLCRDVRDTNVLAAGALWMVRRRQQKKEIEAPPGDDFLTACIWHAVNGGQGGLH